jgi:hypothetical protein
MYPTSTPGVTAKVVSRTSGDGKGLPFTVKVSPGGASSGEVDVTRPVVAAVAHALWQARGGADMTNWADAETVVRQLLGAQAIPAAPASSSRNINIPPPSSESGPLPTTPQPTRRTQSARR